jgi:prepilin-type N-terminal cleavage/methylation domain-containing protein
MSSSRSGRREGFTLAEVLAAVAIIGIVAVFLISQNLRCVRKAARARTIRTATLLAAEKVSEIEMGTSVETSGEFEGHEGFYWALEEEEIGLPRAAVDEEPAEMGLYEEEDLIIFRSVTLLVTRAEIDDPVVTVKLLLPQPILEVEDEE